MNETSDEVEVEKVLCPFYGFYKPRNTKTLLQAKGNACALRSHLLPCFKKVAEEMPDWSSCDGFNHCVNEKAVDKLLSTFIVFPKELGPKNPRQAGVSAREWFYHVMKRKRKN